MRFLFVHNYYQQSGGEDRTFAAEADLLESRGHIVFRYTVHNDRIQKMSSLALAKATFWNGDIYQDLRSRIRQEKSEIVQFHNIFPLISPAAYYAAKAEGIPVIQKLSNYRFFCANGTFFRNERVCEDCFKQCVPWPSVVHACYRNNRVTSGAVASMLMFHRLLGSWKKQVDRFVVSSQFSLQKFTQGGLPPQKVFYKPHFLYPAPDPGTGNGNYAIFVGRFAPNKGLETLLAAWQKLQGKIPLKIIGDGPLADRVADAAERIPGVEWLGRRPIEVVYELMGEAAFLIFPSEWYETFGRVAMEAFAKGTPVVVADIGAIAELVTHRYNGLQFQPGNADDLAQQVEWLLAHPSELAQMRQNARTSFETKYTADENYRQMMMLYEQVLS